MADFPHLDADGRAATLRRLQAVAGTLAEADGAEYDDQGRRVSGSYASFVGWLAGHGIAAAA